jgi:hypothetical protein
MRRFLTVLAALLILASAPAVRASTVSVGSADPRMGQSRLALAGGPGEANRVTMTASALGTVLVRDDGAVLTAGAGCTPLGAHTARCAPGPDGPINVVGADLETANDTFAATTGATVRWNFLAVTGGPGNDSIDVRHVVMAPGADLFYTVDVDAGGGRDSVRGGSGPDALGGGAGRDVLRGGPGPDLLDGDGGGFDETGFDHAARDSLDGGPGRDRVTYAAHRHGVAVDLAHPNSAGSPGEHDRLVSLEDVTGSVRADVLRGGAGPNELVGWEFQSFAEHPLGGDRIAGRAGNDRIRGTSRADRFSGGRGDDRIALAGGLDRTRCGPGRDTVEPGTTPLLLPAGCERLDDGSYTFRGFHVAGGALRAKLRRDDPSALCPEQITLKAFPGAATYGQVAWSGANPPSLVIPLNAAGQAAALHHRLAVARQLGCTGSPHAWLVRL